jgi:uncharacterized integral membrane protein (TIGR00698 family)
MSDVPALSAIKSTIQSLWPGLAVVAVACLAAGSLAEHYGVPTTLCGLLIGFSLSFLNEASPLKSGLSFASTTALRWGIVLLGAQVTLAQFGSIGLVGFAGLSVILLLVIAAGILGARLSGQGAPAGWIAGGATAICGASAAMAIYAVLGRSRISQEQFTLTLVSITVASAVATLTYPVLAGLLDLSDHQAGFLMGAAIHDVAQSLGAGFGYSQAAGETATVVKLTRVALLAPLVVVIGFLVGRASRDDGAAGKPASPLPWFLVGFVALVLVNSFVPVPAAVAAGALAASKTLLLAAVIAAAISARPQVLLSQGLACLVPVLAATAMSLVATLVFCLVVIGA